MGNLPDTKFLKLEQSTGRLDVIFNRPDQRNAMNQQMIGEFCDVLEWLQSNKDVRVAVLRGAGGHFSAGGDIKERRGQLDELDGDGNDPVIARNIQAGKMFMDLEQLPQVTISAITGSAFGGGFGYACVTDITVLAQSAKMGMPETTLGVIPAQIAPYVVKRIGLSMARKMAVTAERIDGQTAYLRGVGQYFCEDTELDTTIDEIVESVLKCGPQANAVTKDIMGKFGTMPIEELSRYSAEQFAVLNRSDEGREGQAAFAEKRKPKWQSNNS